MAVILAMAGDVSVGTRDPVDQPPFHERIQRPVDGRRGSGSISLEVGDQIIGLHRPIGFEQQLQSAFPQRRPAQPRRFAALAPFGQVGSQEGAAQPRPPAVTSRSGLAAGADIPPAH